MLLSFYLNDMAEKLKYSEIDDLLRKFLSEEKHEVKEDRGDSVRGTFTYQCEQEGMPFWVKIGVVLEEDDKRIRDLKNEVAALTALWKAFPNGETDSFMLPPGPETIFDKEYEGHIVYGYSRFLVEGEVLSHDLRDGTERFISWVDRLTAIMKTIDAFPELDLPRTKEKQSEKFDEVIMKNLSIWSEILKKHGPEKMQKCFKDVINNTEEYFKKNKVVTGTAHGQLTPDHIIYMNGGLKPTLVSFTKLSQWYPKYWDLGTIYGWGQAVLGDSAGAVALYEKATKNGYSKNQLEFLNVIVNAVTIGTMGTFVDPAAEGGKLKVGCEAFV